jgi:hypothetical protein
MSMMNVYEKCNDVLIESSLLFVHDTTRVKSIRVEQDVNRGPLAFCMRHCACKRYKCIRVEWDVDREPLAFCTVKTC